MYDHYWGSGWLPSKLQGVRIRSGKDPVLFLKDPEGMTPVMRRSMLDGLNQLNTIKHDQWHDPEIETRIAQYEMAYRMQTSVPELVDLRNESDSTSDLYGADAKVPGTYAFNCLMARRLLERGVRYVSQIGRLTGFSVRRVVCVQAYGPWSKDKELTDKIHTATGKPIFNGDPRIRNAVRWRKLQIWSLTKPETAMKKILAASE